MAEPKSPTDATEPGVPPVPAAPPLSPAASDGGAELTAGLVSGLAGIDLVDWTKAARPAEVVCLCMIAALTVSGLWGSDWVFGSNAELRKVSSGLRHSLVAGEPWDVKTGDLWVTCRAVGNPSSTVCALASAGSAATGLGCTALFICLALLALYIAQHFEEPIRMLQTSLPDGQYARVARVGPVICWGLLLFFLFATLLVYALLAPASMGGGLAHLGVSYGALRLALLIGVMGVSIHLSLVHKCGEDSVIAMLDSLRGHWGHMNAHQQLCQALLAVALLCEALIWIRRVEWGALLIIYGLWSHSTNSHEHLSLFAAAAIFSVGTDALTLASDAADGPFLEVVSWVLLGTKLTVVAILVGKRNVFVS